MNFLADLAAKRQKLLDGIDANEGDINLSIFEGFYPDEAHFIYELLQNAEDAGASEVSFELTPQSCVFEHNGARHFDERDIKAITGIYNSSKKDSPDKIGKFGVGFKSVFVYTETPVIYSKNFSFRIVKYVLPQAVPPKPTLGERTRFEFPFNNPKKNAEKAYVEVKTGLEQLSETTLLFLNNLHYIRWKIGEQAGAVLREKHSDFHIEVLKQLDGKDVFSSHWLRFMTPVEELQRFTAPVDGVERQKVAVAFELEFTGEQKSVDTKTPIATQMKIVPAAKGKVSVFFPADKETSGLRFHLHAPFIPELSRASIKNSPENLPLFEQLAKLTASSLHRIKELDLLTGEFLAVLPNNEDQLPDRYRVIRAAVVREMKEQPLTPTEARGFAPANRLLQARASMKKLLSDDDLAFLLARTDGPTWAIAANQTNSNQDRFLNSLDITRWDVGSLAEYLDEFACNSDERWSELDPKIMTWLGSKPDDWHQLLYATLYSYCEEPISSNRPLRIVKYEHLHDSKIVRLANGGHQSAQHVYFATGPIAADDHFPRVSESVLTVGTRKVQQENARKFLEKIGVRTPGEADELTLILRQRYAKGSTRPSDEIYLADLRRFISYAEKNPDDYQQFSDAFILRISKADSDKIWWATAAAVYLDSPFKGTGLSAYHNALSASEQKKWRLADWYLTCGIELNKLTAFAELVRCSSKLTEFVSEVTCKDNPKYQRLCQVPGERWTTPIDKDYALSKSVQDLLASKNEAFSRLTWTTMCRLDLRHLKARYQKNEANGSRYEDSQLVHTLQTIEWVPLKDGTYVIPRHATRNDLLQGFTFDVGYKWLEAVEFGMEERTRSADNTTMAAKGAELGFDSPEVLQRAQKFARLSSDEQERLLADGQSRQDSKEQKFPDKPVPNKELRNQRVREQAEQTPEKQSEVRSRAVAVGYEAAKDDAKLYLREQYTNPNGVMFCQVCKDELPFKLPNGAYYFEAVAISDALGKRFREAFLSLCPNHTAMFKYANEQRGSMTELVATAAGLEIDLVLAGNETTAQFTEMHLADIKACLEAEDVDETLAPQDRSELAAKSPPPDVPTRNRETRTENPNGRTVRTIYISKVPTDT